MKAGSWGALAVMGTLKLCRFGLKLNNVLLQRTVQEQVQRVCQTYRVLSTAKAPRVTPTPPLSW